MRPHGEIEELLRDSRVWRAGHARTVSAATVASGWPDLDQALGGGWPLGQLTELLVDTHGLGEFTLLLPALRRLADQRGPGDESGWVILIAPPYLPYAPALARSGLDLSRLLLAHSAKDIDTAWAMEQALVSGTCVAVVAWARVMSETSLRRLQLAAGACSAWAVLFRPSGARRSRSPAPLRIQLAWEQAQSRLLLKIIKRRGGGPLTVGLHVGRP